MPLVVLLFSLTMLAFFETKGMAYQCVNHFDLSTPYSSVSKTCQTRNGTRSWKYTSKVLSHALKLAGLSSASRSLEGLSTPLAPLDYTVGCGRHLAPVTRLEAIYRKLWPGQLQCRQNGSSSLHKDPCPRRREVQHQIYSYCPSMHPY
jgi:hypothetical protein